MAAYRGVYDSRHLQADCQEPGSASGTLRSVIEYGLLFIMHVARGIIQNNVEIMIIIRSNSAKCHIAVPESGSGPHMSYLIRGSLGRRVCHKAARDRFIRFCTAH